MDKSPIITPRRSSTFNSFPKKIIKYKVFDTIEDNIKLSIEYYNWMMVRVLDGRYPPSYESDLLDFVDLSFYEIIEDFIKLEFPKKLTLQAGLFNDSTVDPPPDFKEELLVWFEVNPRTAIQINGFIRPGWPNTTPLHINRWKNVKGMGHLEIYFDHIDVPLRFGFHIPNVQNMAKFSAITDRLYEDFIYKFLLVMYENKLENMIRGISTFTPQSSTGNPVENSKETTRSYLINKIYSLPIIDIMIIEHLVTVGKVSIKPSFDLYSNGRYSFIDQMDSITLNDTSEENNNEM